MPRFHLQHAISSRFQFVIRSAAKLLLLACAFTSLGIAPLSSQTLARPGWAGSGLTPQTWWRRAIFYRLDPGTQLTRQQLPSLQAFGIDALVLPLETAAQPQSDAAGSTGESQPLSIDDLFFECSRLHMRVLVPLDIATPNTTTDALLALAKSWLYRGAAGFVLLHSNATTATPLHAPVPSTDTPSTSTRHHHRSTAVHPIHLSQATDPPVIASLKAALAKFPGDHILIADSDATSASINLHLTTLPAVPTADITSHTLLSLANVTVLTPMDAARLLLTPAPALIDSYALTPDSLLRVFPPLAAPPITSDPEKTATPAPSNVYGTYVPYVSKDSAEERQKQAEQKKAAEEAASIAAATFPVQSDYDAIAPTEEGLIAFYHRLVQLHHTAPALLDGELHPLHASQPAWAITHTGAPPIAVVLNPTSTAETVDLTAVLHGIATARLAFRTLSHTAASSGVVHPDKVVVGPNGVYAGELISGYVYR